MRLLLALSCVLVLACHMTPRPSGPVQPLRMGNAHHIIDTQSPEIQREFDAGLDALYAFNFDEAAFWFRLATRAEPACAMCWWGLGMALGPNINDKDKQWPGAREVALRAEKVARTPVEKALTAALAQRYSPGMGMDPAERDRLDETYATAMREVARTYDDDDVLVFLAEAELLVTPRQTPQWTKDGKPSHPGVLAARAAIERVLARSPNHVGAIHYYIHVLDAGPYLALAVPYADKLRTLAPEAGHLVHMASHLYLRVGRYADADDVNRMALDADARFLNTTVVRGPYAMFTMHPAQFLWVVLLWEGARAEALRRAGELAERMHMDAMGDPSAQDFELSFVALAVARFNAWDRVRDLPTPGGMFSAIAIHYARGLALAATGKPDEAAKELDGIHAGIADAAAPPPPPMGPPPEVFAKRKAVMTQIADAASAQLEGAIAEARGDRARAIASLQHAAQLEDQIPEAGEPPMWNVPARQRLGAIQLAAGQAADAESTFRADLAAHPENGWALFGLASALEAQHSPQAPAVWKRFEVAWKRSDIPRSELAHWFVR